MLELMVGALAGVAVAVPITVWFMGRKVFPLAMKKFFENEKVQKKLEETLNEVPIVVAIDGIRVAVNHEEKNYILLTIPNEDYHSLRKATGL